MKKIFKVNPRKDIRDLARFNRIMLILTQQGFGYLFDKVKFKSKRKRLKDPPIRLRKAFEKLGPTFIKLGQILSLRPDLLPKEYVKELGKLQDRVPPFPYKKVEKTIEKELKKPIKELFASFSEKPIASASIAQVHKATLKNGKVVAVKVQRPNVRQIMDTDIEIMTFVAKKLEKHSKKIRKYSPVRIVKEFKQWTDNELNFNREAKNAKRFYRNFKNSDTVKIPKVFDDYSSKRVLTIEFIDGIELHNIAKLKKTKGFKIKEIIKNGFESILTQVFVHGFFHADPHPGNIIVLKDNKIAWVDFGIVGRFNNYLKQKSIELLYGIVEKDMDSIVDTFLTMGLMNENQTDIAKFKEDVRNVIEPLHNSGLKDAKLGYMMDEVLDIALEHHVKLPVDFVLFGKTVIELEGIGLEYSPNFRILENIRPFLENLIKREFRLSNMAKQLMKNLAKYTKLFKDFPDQLNSVLRKIQTGTVRVDIEDTDIKKLATDIDKSSNRMTYGMLIAAFLITGALLVNIGKPVLNGFPLVTLLCFALAIIFAIILFVSIEKEGK